MRGTKVLVRAYGGEPFVGLVWEVGPKGLRVASPEGFTKLGVHGDPPAAGVRWEDIFAFDENLTARLKEAFDRGDRESLVHLWGMASPLRDRVARANL